MEGFQKLRRGETWGSEMGYARLCGHQRAKDKR